MDEFSVSFSPEFRQKAEDAVISNFFTAFMTEEQAKQSKALFRAFSKRGVPARIVIEAIAEVAMEGGFNNG